MRDIVVCMTCRRSQGTKFHALIKAAAAEGATEIRSHQCLWACAQGCAVLLRDDERYGYLLGGFSGHDIEDAEAIVDFFSAHGHTDTGEVDFKRWPERLKGHFIARLPRS